MCKHKLEYCSGCDRVYCSKCEKAWGSFKYPDNGTTIQLDRWTDATPNIPGWDDRTTTFTTVGAYPSDSLS